jgi:hypothetical protein
MVGTLHEDLCIFMIISQILPSRRYISDKSCRENQNTHFMFNNLFTGNCSDYEIMWKNIVELDRPLMIIWHMHITCWIPKATDAHPE